MRTLATLMLSMLAVALVPSAVLADADSTASQLGDRIQSTTEARDGIAIEAGKAVGVVNAPYDKVLEIVQDYGSYKEFMPHFRKSRVLSQRGANALLYLEADIIGGSHTLWAQMRVFKRASEGDREVIDARLIKGNMTRFTARWQLEPVDDGARTLVTFQILVDPDLPLPTPVFSKENKKSARRTIKALRRRIADQGIHLARNP